MALTNTDLKRIDQLIKKNLATFRSDLVENEFNELRVEMYANFVTKQEFNERKLEVDSRFDSLESNLSDVKDIVVQTYQFLTSMFPLTQAQVDSNTKRIDRIEIRLDQTDS